MTNMREKVLNKSNMYIFGIIVLLLGIAFTAFNFYDVKHVGFATTDSQIGNLSASIQTYVACTWSDNSLDVDFGSSLDPSTNDINGTDNDLLSPGTGYNVTVDTLTTSNVNITILGNDLVDGSNIIGVGNVTWAVNNSDNDGANLIPGGSTSITGSEVNIGSDVAPDITLHSRYWLDIPSEAVAGNYVGNYTLQCFQA